MFKRCPLCHNIVWFWEKKCYLDAKMKSPCHANCWLWNMIREMKESINKDYESEIRIEVEDDTWRKGKGIEK